MAFNFGGGVAGGGTTGGFGGFGTNTNNTASASPFGTPSTASTGFGAASKPTTGFGFGSTAPATGTTGLFGGGTTGFGTAPASTGFGNTNPSITTGFGSGGGNPNPASTGFGTSTSTGFGGSSPFAKPAVSASPFGQTNTNVFGTATPATNGAFGSTPTSTTAFGSTAAFGTPVAPNATGGGGGSSLFGTNSFTAAAKSPFGGGTSTGFGGGSGAFGTTTPTTTGTPQVGTGNPPYQSVRESDASGQSTYISISRMPQYQHKSTEELRFEDYLKRTNPSAAQAAAAVHQPQGTAVGGGTSGFGTSGFGTGTTTGGFGGFGTNASTAAPTTGFGGGFGTNTTTPATGFGTGTSGFQASTTTNLFGGGGGTKPLGAFGTTPSTTTGGFGSSGFGAAARPPAAFGTGTFGSNAPSAMGTTSAAPGTGGFGGFGSNNTSTTPATNAFGTTGGTFGKPAVSTGGAFGTGAFGANTTPTTGGFGGFGTNNTATASTNMFGSGGTTGAATGGNAGFSFGNNATKPTTGGFSGFGTNPASGFGTGTTGGFGTTPATGTTTGGLFGTNNSTGFGTGTNAFGSTGTTPNTGMFGSKPGGLFGNTTTTPSASTGMFTTNNMFPSTAKPTLNTGGFGSSSGFGGFGTNTTTTPFGATPSTGLGFGFNQPATGGLQPAQPTQPQPLVAAPDVNPYGSGTYGAGLVEQNVKAALSLPTVNGTSSDSSSCSRLRAFTPEIATMLSTSPNQTRSVLNSRHAMPVPVIRGSGHSFKGTKSRFASVTAARKSTGSSLLEVGNTPQTSTEDGFKFSSTLFRDATAKRLVIDKNPSPIESQARASVIPWTQDEEKEQEEEEEEEEGRIATPDADGTYRVTFRTLSNQKCFTLRVQAKETMDHVRDQVKELLRATMSTTVVDDIVFLLHGRMVANNGTIQELKLQTNDVLDVAITEATPTHKKVTTHSSPQRTTLPAAPTRLTYAEFMNAAMQQEDEEEEEKEKEKEKTLPVSSCCPILRNPKYYTIPSYERIQHMSEQELSNVSQFTVGCQGLGRVEWIGRIDIRDLDLDALIHFEKKEVIVYKEEENKHEVGTGLNRPAIIELLGIFPPRKKTREQEYEAYYDKVVQRTRDIGATFIDYSPDQGIWRFRVEHFSRYGLDDEEDESEDDVLEEEGVLEKADTRFSDETTPQQRMKRLAVVPSRPYGHTNRPDRVQVLRSSRMYSAQRTPNSSVTSFMTVSEPTRKQLHKRVEPEPEQQFYDEEEGQEDIHDDEVMEEHDVEEEEEEEEEVRPHVPTSTVFSTQPFSSSVLTLFPLGIDSETSLLPQHEKSATYQLFLEATKPPASDLDAIAPVVARNHVDMGLFLARSFRVSWGPNGELVNPGTRLLTRSPIVSSRTTTTTTTRVVSIEFPLRVASSPLAVMTRALDMHYTCAQRALEENEDSHEDDLMSPRAFGLPRGQGMVTSLHDYVRFSEEVRRSHHPRLNGAFHGRSVLLWKLIQALWGQEHELDLPDLYVPLAARDDRVGDVETMETYQTVDLRREAISKWFEVAVQSEMDPVDDTPSIARVLELLSQHRLVEATEMAMTCGDFRLSTLVAQAMSYEASNDEFRSLLMDQLNVWSENGALKHMDREMVKVYSALAGSTEVLTTEASNWLICLAQVFWYKRGPATSLSTALSMYREAVHHSMAPVSLIRSNGIEKDDVLMELMKVYVDDGDVSISRVLSPSGMSIGKSSRIHLDYELSWHVQSVLWALGIRLTRKWESHVHQQFICQLESNGLWEYAVYVSLNISDAVEREATCRALLMRNAAMLNTTVDDENAVTMGQQLCAKYMIPVEWVEEALAIAAKNEFSYYDEIGHWIQAKQYDLAHSCLVRYVAPSCLFGGNKNVLRQLLMDLEPLSSHIQQWYSTSGDSGGDEWIGGGGLLLEYFRLQNQEGLESGREMEFLERLQHLAEQLAHRHTRVGGATSVAKTDVVARTALSSMLVALSTQMIQLRAMLHLSVQEENQEERLPMSLCPDFLTALSSFTHTRETKFVERYRASQLVNLCSSFVEWRG